jgi:nitrogen regulatory protein PII
MAGSDETKLITCILPKGIAGGVSEKLLKEKGIVTGHINNARGSGHITAKMHQKAGYQTEKELFRIVVDANRADEVFEFIFEHANLDCPHGGIMFQNALRKSTEYELPTIDAES